MHRPGKEQGFLARYAWLPEDNLSFVLDHQVLGQSVTLWSWTWWPTAKELPSTLSMMSCDWDTQWTSMNIAAMLFFARAWENARQSCTSHISEKEWLPEDDLSSRIMSVLSWTIRSRTWWPTAKELPSTLSMMSCDWDTQWTSMNIAAMLFFACVWENARQSCTSHISEKEWLPEDNLSFVLDHQVLGQSVTLWSWWRFGPGPDGPPQRSCHPLCQWCRATGTRNEHQWILRLCCSSHVSGRMRGKAAHLTSLKKNGYPRIISVLSWTIRSWAKAWRFGPGPDGPPQRSCHPLCQWCRATGTRNEHQWILRLCCSSHVPGRMRGKAAHLTSLKKNGYPRIISVRG